MKTYSFKLYSSRKNRHLHQQINLACEIYNHCIALHKRYYRLYGKYPHVYSIQKHITKLKKLPGYGHWKNLNSQAIQNITERIDRAYRLFFRNLKAGVKTAPPSFRKRSKYRSFSLKRTGYKLLDGNSIRMGSLRCVHTGYLCLTPESHDFSRGSMSKSIESKGIDL